MIQRSKHKTTRNFADAVLSQARQLPPDERRKLMQEAERAAKRDKRILLACIPSIVIDVPSFWPLLSEPFAARNYLIAAAGAAAAAVIGLIWMEKLKRDARVRYLKQFFPYLCGSCGYNLTGNTSGTCPECGAQINPAVRGDSVT